MVFLDVFLSVFSSVFSSVYKGGKKAYSIQNSFCHSKILEHGENEEEVDCKTNIQGLNTIQSFLSLSTNMPGCSTVFYI